MAGKKKETKAEEVKVEEVKELEFKSHYMNMSFRVLGVNYSFKDGLFKTSDKYVIEFLKKLDFVK